MVRPPADKLTRSLTDLRPHLLAIVRAGIRAAAAGPLVERALSGGRVSVPNANVDTRPPYSTDTRPPYAVIAAGKAAPAMAIAAARCLGSQVGAGLVVGTIASTIPDGFELVVGGHPVPTAASEQGGRKALALAQSLTPDQTLLVLLSGGASALMAVPADGLSLAEKRATTERLLRAGADILALNTVRKHLSAIKGGWLAAHAAGACQTLVVSDVVGDDVSVIASGPTVGDASLAGDALDVLRRFDGEAAYPSAVVERLRRGADGGVPETPKPGDPRLARTETTVIGSRRDAMAGAAAEAASLGYQVLLLDDPVVGEARTTAIAHLRAVLARVADVGRPVCVISSGETTVHVTGHGKGGRNQEFALAAAELVGTGLRTGIGSPYRDPSPMSSPDPSPMFPMILASVGTDGVDGPTDAAGALVDSTTLDRARAAGLVPDRFLLDNNAYAFFDALGDLIHTGPTGTNVGDLQVVLLG